MSFWKNLGIGISTHVKAIEFIAKHNLWYFFLFPVIIMALLWVGGFWSTMALGNWLVDQSVSWLGLESDTEGWLSWLQTILQFLVGLILKILLLFVFSSYIKYIVLIICSPILALLSEKCDEIITGKTYPFQLGQFLHDMLRGVLVTLRNMLLETLIILGCMLIAWIPVIGWITVPFLYVVAWYFLGFSMMDYTYERQKWSISKGTQFTRDHKGIAIGNGFIFSVIMMIPILGVLIAPILSVVAATLAVMEATTPQTNTPPRV